MKINIKEVTKFLNDNLEKYKRGDKPLNIYFLCRHDLPLDNLILDWFEGNNLDPLLNVFPNVLHEENKQGFLVKTNPPIYVFSNGYEQSMGKPFVLYYKMFNYGRDFDGDHMLIDLLSKEIAPNSGFKALDLKNRMFTIAYGFTKDSGNRVKELAKELTDLFTVYVVEEDLRYALETKYQQCKRYEEILKEKGDEAAYSYKLHASYIKKLLDTGFNISDCGVYMENMLERAFDEEITNTFDKYKDALIQSIEDDINCTFAIVTDKAKVDGKAIIEWLKGIQ